MFEITAGPLKYSNAAAGLQQLSLYVVFSRSNSPVNVRKSSD